MRETFVRNVLIWMVLLTDPARIGQRRRMTASSERSIRAYTKIPFDSLDSLPRHISSVLISIWKEPSHGLARVAPLRMLHIVAPPADGAIPKVNVARGGLAGIPRLAVAFCEHENGSGYEGAISAEKGDRLGPTYSLFAVWKRDFSRKNDLVLLRRSDSG